MRCCKFAAAAFDPITQKRILTIGDSKTVPPPTLPGGVPPTNTWIDDLVTALNVAAGPNVQFAADNVGVGASTSTTWAANINAVLAGQSSNHVIILFNVSVNDFGITSDADYIVNVLTVADACKAKWPAVTFYISKMWKRGFDSTADHFAGLIDTIAAARTFIVVADDERGWLKGADNGNTMTVDGIHYSVAGETEKVNQMKTVLGF